MRVRNSFSLLSFLIVYITNYLKAVEYKDGCSDSVYAIIDYLLIFLCNIVAVCHLLVFIFTVLRRLDEWDAVRAYCTLSSDPCKWQTLELEPSHVTRV